ncbi:DNA replication licensing factor MCM8 [Babesia divergens]|uniref:DNA replication licensing factor MCM8 n=1 Tax=Babesia divergens TaxID=32595 RepID=A0AAD9LH07_BABDI|nr:DNA replication licensing factor MCM8 [Babesia divergens]
MTLQNEVFKHLSYLYFTVEDVKGSSSLANSFNEWTEFFLSHWKRLVAKREESFLETLELSIDYVVLLECIPPEGVDDFKKTLYTKPSLLLSCMSAGLHLATLQKYADRLGSDGAELKGGIAGDLEPEGPVLFPPAVVATPPTIRPLNIKKHFIANKLLGSRLSSHLFFSETRIQCARVRLENFLPISPFNSLRSFSVGCIISIVGQVIRISLTKPMILSALFTCNRCGCSFFKKFKNGIFEYASRCYNEDCNWTSSSIQRHCVQTTNRQVIRLQEESRTGLATDSRFGNSTINAFVDVELTGGLVDQCSPGNVVQVVGIVDVTPSTVCDDVGGHNSTFNIFVKAVSLRILKKGHNLQTTSVLNSDYTQWNNTNVFLDSERCIRGMWKGSSILGNPGSPSRMEHGNFRTERGDETSDDSSGHNFIRDIYYQEPNRFYLVAASLCRQAIGRPYIKGNILFNIL